MAVNAELIDGDEERLAALWEQPMNATSVGDESADDAITELFTSRKEAAADPTLRPHASHTRRAARPRSQRRCGRVLLPRPRAAIACAIGSVLVAALALGSVARTVFTASTVTTALGPRLEPGAPPAARPAAPPSRNSLQRLRPPAAPPRAQRRLERRQPIARAAPPRGRAARRTRAVRIRARSRSPLARRFSAAPVAPRTPPPQPVLAPESSACEEFPPC